MRPALLLLLALAGCDADAPKDDTDTDVVVDTEPVDTEPPADTDVDTDTDDGPVEAGPLDVTLSPEAPLEGDALSCTADTTTQVAWTWSVDGASASIASADVPAGRTTAHETWTCRGETVDGLYVGEASVEIGELCLSLHHDLAAPQPAFVPDAVGRTALRAVDDAFTAEAWFLRTRTGVDQDLLVHQQPVLLFKPPKVDFVVRVTADERLEFVTSLKEDAHCGTLDAPAPSAGTWHHVAVSWDPATSGTKRIYVDGTLADSCQSTDRPTGPVLGDLTIGGSVAVSASPFQHPFQGWIDEVRLSSTERYRLNFTPQTFFNPDADTIVLLHLDRTFETTAGTATTVWTPDAGPNHWDAQLFEGLALSPERSACRTGDTAPVDVDTDTDVPADTDTDLPADTDTDADTQIP